MVDKPFADAVAALLRANNGHRWTPAPAEILG